MDICWHLTFQTQASLRSKHGFSHTNELCSSKKGSVFLKYEQGGLQGKQVGNHWFRVTLAALSCSMLAEIALICQMIALLLLMLKVKTRYLNIQTCMCIFVSRMYHYLVRLQILLHGTCSFNIMYVAYVRPFYNILLLKRVNSKH